MDATELEKNLGTIAKSGTEEFKKELGEKSDLEVIGQFGVGFYSAYMVSEKVEVYTLSPFSDKGYKFTSNGTENYTIDEVDGLKQGTKIVLYLRKNKDEDTKKGYPLNNRPAGASPCMRGPRHSCPGCR